MIASILWFQETLTLGEGQSLNLADIWVAGGWMMWPLGAALAIGVLIILWKLVDLQLKASKNKKVLRDADEMIAGGNLGAALDLCNESAPPPRPSSRRVSPDMRKGRSGRPRRSRTPAPSR